MRAQCLQHGLALRGEFKYTVGVTELDPSVFLTQFQMLTHFDQGDISDPGNASSLPLFVKFLELFEDPENQIVVGSQSSPIFSKPGRALFLRYDRIPLNFGVARSTGSRAKWLAALSSACIVRLVRSGGGHQKSLATKSW